MGCKIKKNNQEKGSVENDRRDRIQRVKDAWSNRIADSFYKTLHQNLQLVRVHGCRPQNSSEIVPGRLQAR